MAAKTKASKKKEESEVTEVTEVKENLSAREKLLVSIEKEFGQGSVFLMGKNSRVDWQFRPTGSLALDYALGGGIPYGAAVAIIGDEGVGKSSIAEMMCAEVQRSGEHVLYIDGEQALNLEWAKKNGVVIPAEGENFPQGVGGFFLHQPTKCAEEVLKFMESMIEKKEFGLIILDSIPSLVPKKEWDGEMDEQQMGLVPQLLGKAIRKLIYSGKLKDSKTSLVLINQNRDLIGSFFGGKRQPGGRNLKYCVLQTLDVSSAKIEATVEGQKQRVGQEIHVNVTRNKFATPYRTANVNLFFESGIDYLGDIILMATALNLIQISGSWMNCINENGEILIEKVQGKENFKLALCEKPDTIAYLKDRIRTILWSE